MVLEQQIACIVIKAPTELNMQILKMPRHEQESRKGLSKH